MKTKVLILIVLILLSACARVSKQPDEGRQLCTSEDREVDACPEIFQPVCGWYDSENVQCIKYPCAQSFGNSCHACSDEDVEFYTEGECPQ